MPPDDTAFVNPSDASEASILRGTRRLLRDLATLALVLQERPTASERLEARVGRDLAAVLRASLVAPDPARGLQPRQAA